MINKIKKNFPCWKSLFDSTSRKKGQSLVEVAIFAPLLIFLLLGLFEVGWALRGYLVLVNVNREITRYATRTGYLDFSTLESVDSSYQTVRDWAYGSNSGQLPLDARLEGNTTIIITHLVVDTALPCSEADMEAGKCDCDAFMDAYENGSVYNKEFTLDDLILHPGIPGQEYQTTRFGPDETVTGRRDTRINYEEEVKRLRAQNNKFNCELAKKGGTLSNNNVIITEMFYDQPQLFGFPFISNPFTDPVPLYTHTSMRLVNAVRGYNLETAGPVCMAYPITFHENIFGGNPDYPPVPMDLDIYEGSAPGNFGWLTWNPHEKDAKYVEEELKNPRLSLNDFTDPTDPSDHMLSVGDNVSTKPGVANSNGIDEQLQALVGQEIIIPVHNNNPGGGATAYYHISHFAKVRVNQICLPRNSKDCGGGGKKHIWGTFLGYVDEWCQGTASTLPTTTPATPSTPTQTPITTPTQAATQQAPTATPTQTPTATPTQAPTATPTSPANRPPKAEDDWTMTGKNQSVIIQALDNDNDPDGDHLTIISKTNPSNGTVTISADGRTLTYKPKKNDSLKSYTFTYTIADGRGGTDTASVTVLVLF